MPLLETKGAASAQGFGFTLGGPANYIEDVFSTWLYTGNGATQTITNGIDLAGKGGLVWTKSRNNAQNHIVNDTVRGAGKQLIPNSTLFQQNESTALTSFNSNGFSLGSKSDVNDAANTYVSWTFREQPKFFDVVTYTGNGANRTIAHNLGSAPGCIIVKRLDSTSEWYVYHRSLTSAAYGIELNNTGAQSLDTTLWNSTAPTTSVFSLGTSGGINASGGTYVAYLFAHNAGGFGLTGNDNVVSCGSYTGTGAAGLNVTLGYEPQFVLIKRASGGTGDWNLIDTMRGWPNSTTTSYKRLLANTSAAEDDGGAIVAPTATGFTFLEWTADLNASGSTYIYIAIRRGPMKVPTTGTSVYNTILQTPQSSGTVRTVGFPADLMIGTYTAAATPRLVNTRLTGFANTSGASQNTPGLQTQSTNAESNQYPLFFNVWNTTARDGDYIFGSNGVNWMFRRAPGFFDEVCYSGTGAIASFNHNLTTAPELMIVKPRSSTGNWITYSSTLGSAKVLLLNSTSAEIADANIWNSTNPTSTVFTVGSSYSVSGQTYVAYLFASAPGVSKVGSYTGTATTQVINCGFTGGARFVLIKATSTTGNWYVWDSARGIVAGNDPYLELNTTAAEVTTTDWVDTAATGFELSNAGGNLANSNGVTYIFWAIA